MPASLWKPFASPENGREYLALLPYLSLNEWSAMPRFMKYTLRIRRQLADSYGLIGYSMDANLPSRSSGPYRCGRTKNP